MEKQFMSKFHQAPHFSPGRFNGFTHPKTPVITAQEPQFLQLFNWGLLPNWAKDASFAKNTLNAKLETLHEKPSFSHYTHQRCLILSNGFFEWHWQDAKGKNKQAFHVHLPNNALFAFAGLWNAWIDKQTGEIRPTYTIITTAANELMERIHNTKKRMPLVLSASQGKHWLGTGELNTANEELVGDEIEL
jgi:putative SOS response-associated peptidase YedK